MNNTMVREIRGTKIIQNRPLKIGGRKIRGGGNNASKYGILIITIIIINNNILFVC